MKEKEQGGTSPIGFSPTRMMELVPNVYPSQRASLKEPIQNAIDSGAKNVKVNINVKLGFITVDDDGCGCSRAEFDEKVARIGTSSKAESKDSKSYLGKLGLGLVSFYGKCGQFRFISFPKGGKDALPNEGYTIHDFGAVNLEGATLEVPWTVDTDVPATRWWHTRVEVGQFSEAFRLAIDPQSLARDIAEEFGERMAFYDTNLTIDHTNHRGQRVATIKVLPTKFTGQLLPPHRTTGKECGNVTFEIYSQKRSNPSHKILLKINDSAYRRALEDSKEMAISWGFNEEAMKDLCSGFLEGIITVEKAEWAHGRATFENNEASFEFFTLIEKWYHKVGHKHVPDIRNERLELIDREGLNRLVKRLRLLSQSDDSLARVINLIHPGAAISVKHAEVKGTKPTRSGTTGDREIPKSTTVPAEVTKPKPSGSNEEQKTKSETAGVLHIGMVTDIDAYKRLFSKKQPGIWVSSDDLPGSRQRCVYDQKYGIFQVNKRHPDYLDIQGHADAIEEYLFEVVLQAMAKMRIDESNQIVLSEIVTYEDTMMMLKMPRIRELCYKAKKAA